MRTSGPSSSGFERALELEFARSAALRLCWVGLHLLTAWLALNLSGLWLQMVAALLVLASAVCSARLPGCGWTARALVTARRHPDGSWTLRERSGREFEACLARSWVSASRVVFLTWVTPDRSYPAILIPGLVASCALRRLRAMLAAPGHP